LCDCAQTETITGWKAEVDLPTGLRRTLSWLERNEHRYRPREYAL
jgi:nucleoside-diphosphate-sugar epimerase